MRVFPLTTCLLAEANAQFGPLPKNTIPHPILNFLQIYFFLSVVNSQEVPWSRIFTFLLRASLYIWSKRIGLCPRLPRRNHMIDFMSSAIFTSFPYFPITAFFIYHDYKSTRFFLYQSFKLSCPWFPRI